MQIHVSIALLPEHPNQTIFRPRAPVVVLIEILQDEPQGASRRQPCCRTCRKTSSPSECPESQLHSAMRLAKRIRQKTCVVSPRTHRIILEEGNHNKPVRMARTNKACSNKPSPSLPGNSAGGSGNKCSKNHIKLCSGGYLLPSDQLSLSKPC